jgi:nucleoside-diphosphate-sugar epimerase
VRVLVTGARGMLGAAVARALAARGDAVAVLQRGPSGLPVPEVRADLGDPDAPLAEALAGHDAVVHLAAKVDVVGPWREYRRTNVDGTRALLAAARSAGVTRFVHVSSPSVAHAGPALVGAPAALADPARARGHYARSKALAEQVALAAASRALAVVAVRPHLVWGPGDPQLVGRIVARARAGRLPVVGTGTALVDTTYVDNAVDALVAALDRAPHVSGRAFVVSNGEPRPVAELVASICAASGVAPPRIAVPAGVARAVGAAVEKVCRHDPPMTRFLAEQLSTAHWFDQRATRAALEWTPRVGLDEGLARLRAG